MWLASVPSVDWASPPISTFNICNDAPKLGLNNYLSILIKTTKEEEEEKKIEEKTKKREKEMKKEVKYKVENLRTIRIRIID